VESWLKVLREAAPGRPGRDGKAPVKKLSKRFLDQQRKGK
jgi:hypothetical protein